MHVVRTILIVCFLPLMAAGQTFTQSGLASFYADKYEGRTTASGEKYRHSQMTAAHKTLPFGTIVRVVNMENDAEVRVKINDRGPYVDGRIIDLSRSAAEKLGFVTAGLAEVQIEVLDAGDGKGNSYSANADYDEPPVDEREFYDFDIARIQPAGYGVQIGSYRELVNLVRLAENLKSSYRKKVTVWVSIVQGDKYYRLIVGKEKSRKKAEALKAKLARKYPDCYIIDFGEVSD